MRRPELHEDSIYYFDEAEADRVVKFARKYCAVTDQGEPLVLNEWQIWILRSLFGWKHRDTHLPRFRELYLLTAKGAGKTPLLTIIGLYLLFGGQRGVSIISCASTLKQANELSFGDAKKFIAQSKDLQSRCEPQEKKIKARNDCIWWVLSGKGSGRAGFRPNVVVADEVHEWLDPTFQSFTDVCNNLFKRPGSLKIVATNAGSSRTGQAYKMHDRALKVLDGELIDETLLPVICEAPIDLDWASEEAAKAANPSLGTFVKFDQLKPWLARAKIDPEVEADYRQKVLSQWTQSTKKLLNLYLWDHCTKKVDIGALKNVVLYVGVDPSPGDDFFAVSYCYCHDGGIHVDCDFWTIRETADKYEVQYGTPYKQWEKKGHIRVLDAPTISVEAQLDIAKTILERKKHAPIKAVSFDPNRGGPCTAALDAAGVVTVATRQGYSLTPGCSELLRRLKEGTITIAPNECLRAQADVVEFTEDSQNNFYPAKPAAKGKYAGKRQVKIDGISALVTALVEARKYSFPKIRAATRAIII